MSKLYFKMFIFYSRPFKRTYLISLKRVAGRKLCTTGILCPGNRYQDETFQMLVQERCSIVFLVVPVVLTVKFLAGCSAEHWNYSYKIFTTLFVELHFNIKIFLLNVLYLVKIIFDQFSIDNIKIILFVIVCPVNIPFSFSIS